MQDVLDACLTPGECAEVHCLCFSEHYTSGVARNIELVGHCLCTLPKAVHRGAEHRSVRAKRGKNFSP